MPRRGDLIAKFAFSDEKPLAGCFNAGLPNCGDNASRAAYRLKLRGDAL
jgi:hypothetical protein